MADREKALAFLDAFTEYLEWRGRERRPPAVDERTYVSAFRPYADSCGITDAVLRNDLVKKMQDVATARGGSGGEVPRSDGGGGRG